MSDILYSKEKFLDVYDEMWPLLEEHYSEVAMYQDSFELCPDIKKYEDLCELDVLHIYTARDAEDVLIGYFVVIVAPHLHYSKQVVANNDVIYIDKAYRKKSLGARLILFAEEDLKKLGVIMITLNTKCKQPFYELCEGLGYDKMEVVYSKLLVEGEE